MTAAVSTSQTPVPDFGELTFTPVSFSQGGSSPAVAPLDSIPQSVKTAVEEAWEFFSAKDYTDDQALTVNFADKATKLRFVGLATSYANQRSKAVKDGEDLHIRVSPMRGVPEGSLTFRMRTMAAEKARKEETARIRATAKAAKDAETAKAGKGK